MKQHIDHVDIVLTADFFIQGLKNIFKDPIGVICFIIDIETKPIRF